VAGRPSRGMRQASVSGKHVGSAETTTGRRPHGQIGAANTRNTSKRANPARKKREATTSSRERPPPYASGIGSELQYALNAPSNKSGRCPRRSSPALPPRSSRRPGTTPRNPSGDGSEATHHHRTKTIWCDLPLTLREAILVPDWERLSSGYAKSLQDNVFRNPLGSRMTLRCDAERSIFERYSCGVRPKTIHLDDSRGIR
jgi:hypothetical protein